MNLSVSEQLAYNTVRIVTDVGTGTGFFYRFAEQDGGMHVPAIVTNKHVVEGASKGVLLLTLQNDEGEPQDTEHFQCQFDDFEKQWTPHPEIDLCALPVARVLKAMEEKSKKPFFIPLNKSVIPSDEELAELKAVEDVLMVGYPNGLWDEINNLPLFRRGITASHPNKDWNGKSEMLIDAACFPGSSGSPVFLFSEGGYVDKRGNTNLGATRCKLFGVLYAGPQHTAEGEIEIVNVPTVDKPIAVTGIPNNLGIVIKAKKLAELDAIFLKALNEDGA